MGERIIVFANKWWEAVPLIGVLTNKQACPTDLSEVSRPVPSGASAITPRLFLRCREFDVETWCVQDLMNPDENPSLTWEKARVLPRAIDAGKKPRLVVSLGSAACPNGDNQNGNVVIGSSVFIHDPIPSSAKHWGPPSPDKIVLSDAAKALDAIPKKFVGEATKRLLSPPNKPAKSPEITLGNNLVSVSDVNVTDRALYAKADKETLDAFAAVAGPMRPGSMETTHGMIRMVADAPFLYVSGFANAVGKYLEDVIPNEYAQNFVAAHNAAIGLAWLLPEVVQYL
jgi:hypothetical protein